MILRLSLAVLRLFAKVVPARDRDEWLAEWESELQARRERLASHHRLTPEQELDMFRRVLGSFHDAAWLRRQFTLDADVVHDFKHGARLLLRSPLFALLTISVLATGIGATTGIFSVVDALLVRQLPYHDRNGSCSCSRPTPPIDVRSRAWRRPTSSIGTHTCDRWRRCRRLNRLASLTPRGPSRNRCPARA